MEEAVGHRACEHLTQLATQPGRPHPTMQSIRRRSTSSGSDQSYPSLGLTESRPVPPEWCQPPVYLRPESSEMPRSALAKDRRRTQMLPTGAQKALGQWGKLFFCSSCFPFVCQTLGLCEFRRISAENDKLFAWI